MPVRTAATHRGGSGAIEVGHLRAGASPPIAPRRLVSRPRCGIETKPRARGEARERDTGFVAMGDDCEEFVEDRAPRDEPTSLRSLMPGCSNPAIGLLAASGGVSVRLPT
jgi:hypothetical protein